MNTRRENIATEKVDKNYYNLEDIIASNSSVSCSFGRHSPRGIMALIGQPVPDTSSAKECKVEIPLFLAETINQTGIGMVHLTFPFNNRLLEVLQADAQNVDLEALHQHFYLLGRHLTGLVNETHAQLLAETLLNTFLQRVGQIITRSLNSCARATKLDSTEKRLYAIGMYTEALLADWFEGIDEGCKRTATPLKIPI